MKKKYILIPLICVVVLLAVIIGVAIAMNRGYFKELPYDHVNSTVYNGVEIVGDDGLLYLVKDGKRVSRGYTSLQSVNDFYEDMERNHSGSSSVVLFDYYIAKGDEKSNYLLVTPRGDEITISGDQYSLDRDQTSLPYLVFTNNANGLKSVISLHNLSSDLSLRNEDELSLKSFKEVRAFRQDENDTLYSYIVTTDASSGEQVYFRYDGNKITSGKNIETVNLVEESGGATRVFLFNTKERSIYSVSDGSLIASGVVELLRDGYSDWRYARCQNKEGTVEHIVTFTAETSNTISHGDLSIVEAYSFGNCIVAPKTGGTETAILGLDGSIIGTYDSVSTNNGIVLTALSNGKYFYLNKNGKSIMDSEYGDLVADQELSSDTCAVLTSEKYDEANSGRWLHFAREGAQLYSLNKNLILSIGKLACDGYHVTKEVEGKTVSSVLAPFSETKCSPDYDSFKVFSQNGIAWVLATSYSRLTYDIIDPLTAEAFSVKLTSEDDFAKHVFTHEGNIALATDKSDTDTAVHMSVIKLAKYDTDDIVNNSRYFVLYRSAAHTDKQHGMSPLNVTEIGKDLLLKDPYDVFTSYNYLVANTTSGSTVYSLNESLVLVATASLPYSVDKIMTDYADHSVRYFKVVTDTGLYGLYSPSSEAILAPYYTDITSAEDGYFTVKLREAYGVIHFDGRKVKTVVDFLYARILPLGDKGYYAVTGVGDIDIYSGRTVIFSESVQSLSTLKFFSTDDEGKLIKSEGILMGARGKLYVHYPEHPLDDAFEEYKCGGNVDTGDLNARAKAIYYYRGSELVHTDVIHHGEAIGELFEAEGGTVWYTTDNANEQNESSTITSADSLKGYIIKLYTKND